MSSGIQPGYSAEAWAMQELLCAEARLRLPRNVGNARRFAQFARELGAQGLDEAARMEALRGLVRYVRFYLEPRGGKPPRYTTVRLMPGKLLDSDWWPSALAAAEREKFCRLESSTTTAAAPEEKKPVRLSEEEIARGAAELEALRRRLTGGQR